jgi:hypothetical protein
MAFQIEVSDDDCRPDGIHVLSRFFGGVDALGARRQMLFDAGKLGFGLHHSKVVSLKVVVGDVVDAHLVCGTAENSHDF